MPPPPTSLKDLTSRMRALTEQLRQTQDPAERLELLKEFKAALAQADRINVDLLDEQPL